MPICKLALVSVGAQTPAVDRVDTETIREDGRVFPPAVRMHQRVHVAVHIHPAAASAATRKQTVQIQPELLPDRAIQQEVDGMVRVHEKLRHRLYQTEVHLNLYVVLPSRVQLCGDHRHVYGHRENEKDEGHREKHDRDAAVLRASPAFAGVRCVTQHGRAYL